MIRRRNDETTPFSITSVVSLRCLLTTLLLFISYIDDICKQSNPDDIDVNELLFADDKELISEISAYLQRHLNRLSQCCNKQNMRISKKKTEVMMIGREKKELYVQLEDTN